MKHFSTKVALIALSLFIPLSCTRACQLDEQTINEMALLKLFTNGVSKADQDLLWAVENNDINMVHESLTSDLVSCAYSALDIAIAKGYLDATLLLIQYCANCPDVLRFSPRTGRPVQIVESTLLTKDVSVNEVYSSGKTPLHYAVARSKVGAVRLLLANGANTTLKDRNNYTPAMIGARSQITKNARITKLGMSLAQASSCAHTYIALYCHKSLPIGLVRNIIDQSAGPDEVPLFKRIHNCQAVQAVAKRVQEELRTTGP